MADTRHTVTAPARNGRGGRVFPTFYGWRIVAALAISQTVGYGVLSYAFGVILTPMRHDLGLSLRVASGAVTLSLLVCAATSIPVGRWLDRHGGYAREDPQDAAERIQLGELAVPADVTAWAS